MMMNSNSESSSNGPTPKRARVTKSCTICRQKKIKCDKKKPACGSCTKKGRVDLCRYEEPEWNVKVVNNGNINNAHHGNESLDEQLLMMREKLKQIENTLNHERSQKNNSTPDIFKLPNDSGFQVADEDDDDIIDFYKNNYGHPRMITQGVLSWVTLLKKDVYLKSIVDSSRRKKIMITSRTQPNDVKESEFLRKFKVEQDLDVDMKPENIGLSPCKYKNKDLVFMIGNALSDAKLVWLLVDKFFESELYCILPLLDRTDFTSQLFDIIGPKNTHKIVLKITKKIQLTTIGILLVIMRLASLSTYNALRFNYESLSPNDKYIYDNPVPRDVMAIVKRCFDEISLFRESHLEIFQFQLLVRYYDFYGPEDCDCISVASGSDMGPLLCSAVSAGLNRDPSIAESDHKNPNLLRRLWYKVVNLDYNQLMLIGCPPAINSRFYDTQYPTLDYNDSAFEYAVNKAVHSRKDVYEMCHHVLMLILNLRDPPKMSVLKENIRTIEKFVYEHPKLPDILKMSSDGVLQRLEKINLVYSLVDTCSLLYMIYYHFFLYYNEKKNKDKSLHYFCEMIRLTTIVFPMIKFLLQEKEHSKEFNLAKQFGAPILVIPKIELSAHRSIQFMFSLLARIKSEKVFHLDISAEKLEILDNIADLALRASASILKGFQNIADFYYHAWAMNKMHTFIIKSVLHNKRGMCCAPENMSETDREFTRNLNSVREHDEIFSKYTLEDLNKIYELMQVLETSGNNADKHSSPTGSLDMTFNLNDNKNDQIWFKQLQLDTDFLYESGNNNANANQVNTNNDNTQQLNDPLLDGIDPASNFDIFDIERFFYHSTNESYLME